MNLNSAFLPDVAEAAIRTLASWKWLVTSGQESTETEERRSWCINHFGDLARLTLKRTQSDIPYRFTLFHNDVEEAVNWNELGQLISKIIPAGESILLDTTHLSFDTLLYLLPALRDCQPASLACLYVAPTNFDEIQTDSLEVQNTLPIGQPRGYVALTTEETRPNSQHMILLGFDRGRAWKFIQRYDWDEAHLHLLLGDPPFVDGGDQIALESCQPWLESFRKRSPDHIHRLDARDPEMVQAFLKLRLEESHWLDIVPLGPKPMLLGVLWFYFGLSERDQARVRLLYDFSEQRARRCNGVQMVHFWSCTV
ncbi:hypothetical protein [Ferrovum myxofaciens]|uniref:hypothetical protein n=1 Tax=Ferrovum myxofaciens TaxID=416213 RepID=UPI000AFAE544|nr:hypothetical protein [Ferrovum myxofaciens]